MSNQSLRVKPSETKTPWQTYLNATSPLDLLMMCLNMLYATGMTKPVDPDQPSPLEAVGSDSTETLRVLLEHILANVASRR